jgi:hypothetical protein
MEEIEYLRSGTMLVTSTRVEIEGQTFAVRNIGSVKVERAGTPWIAAILALLCAPLLFVPDARIFGAAVIAGAIAWIVQQLRVRKLVLVSGGGETVALSSKDAAAVEALRNAIAQAISAR